MKKSNNTNQLISAPKNAKIFATLLQRDLIAKRRNKMNIYISFVIPPLLGLIIGFILRYSKADEYNLYENKHFPTFFFLATLVVLFLAISNSIEEVVKERNILSRETRIYKSASLYYLSKLTTLLAFAIIQNTIFLSVSYAILEIRELFFSHLLILTLLSLTGITIGLFVSSIPNISTKAVNNLVPLILIPQIILGGALIEYREMNESIIIDNSNPIPEICQLIPSRWGFEALVINQALNNKFHPKHNTLKDSLSIFRKKIPKKNFIAQLASESGVTIDEASSLATKRENHLRAQLSEHEKKYRDTHGNLMLEITAEIQQSTQKEQKGHLLISPLFSHYKRVPFTTLEIKTPLFNGAVLLLLSLITMVISILMLRRSIFSL